MTTIRQAMGDPAEWPADLFDYWLIEEDLARLRLYEICCQFPDLPVPPEIASWPRPAGTTTHETRTKG
ncbi:hypothetical protein AB0K49_13600 [Streptomyces decoyicus]|uniref:hypothetical protein n=1 Tax=Streptomyces decoyicus TaxID=249567 RepID=UPI00345DCDBF